MEHVVQFGINIDDAAIQKAVEANATKAVLDDIIRDTKRELGLDGRYGYRSEFADEVAAKIIEAYKDRIIEQAVERLCKSVPRSKWFKEGVGKKLSGNSGPFESTATVTYR